MNTSWFPLYQQSNPEEHEQINDMDPLRVNYMTAINQSKKKHNCVITIMSQIMTTQPLLTNLYRLTEIYIADPFSWDSADDQWIYLTQGQ